MQKDIIYLIKYNKNTILNIFLTFFVFYIILLNLFVIYHFLIILFIDK